MNNLNYTLFEEYKVLDKLCGEIYDDPHGVTRYIEDMKKVSPSIYRHLPNWQIDLEHLKLIRHIRNYLAHTQGAFDETVCTEQDITWIRDFYSRLLKQSDPLALLYQYSKTTPKKTAAKPAPQPQRPLPVPQFSPNNKRLPETNTEESRSSDRSSSIFPLLAILLVIGVLLLAAFCIYITLSISLLSSLSSPSFYGIRYSDLLNKFLYFI